MKLRHCTSSFLISTREGACILRDHHDDRRMCEHKAQPPPIGEFILTFHTKATWRTGRTAFRHFLARYPPHPISRYFAFHPRTVPAARGARRYTPIPGQGQRAPSPFL